MMVAQDVEVRPVTVELPVRNTPLSVSVIVYLGKTLHTLCLLLVGISCWSQLNVASLLLLPQGSYGCSVAHHH